MVLTSSPRTVSMNGTVGALAPQPCAKGNGQEGDSRTLVKNHCHGRRSILTILPDFRVAF